MRREPYDESVRARIAQEEAADRARRRTFARVLAVCALWVVAGLGCYAWAMRMMREDYALLLLDVGRVVGIGGIIVTVIWYRAWAERHGHE
jgi:hypothetical protein